MDEGSRAGRIKLSDLGHQILANSREKSLDRDARVRQAALLPKAHRELWEELVHASRMGVRSRSS